MRSYSIPVQFRRASARWFVMSAVVFAGFLPLLALADNVSWTVNDTMHPKVTDFMKSSPIADEMRREKEPNLPVRVLDQRAPGLLMSDDVVACLHLTNPDSDMEIDSGGGFYIYIKQVTFPGGTWDVHLRIRELDRIDELDKTKVLVLDKLIIGTLRFRDSQKLTKALRLLTKACFE